jgi:hypothetical protein
MYSGVQVCLPATVPFNVMFNVILMMDWSR